MGRWVTSLLALTVTGASCATPEAPSRAPLARHEVALRRGSAWMTYAFSGYRIVGPAAELRLTRGKLRGNLGARPIDIAIGANEANGYGPQGAVILTIDQDDAGLRVEGTWNDEPVHMLFSADLLEGSLVVRGRDFQELSCSYELDHRDAQGALVGISTCSGLPQVTRLEIDRGVGTLLSASELGVFLVAALSAPPFAPNERL